MNKKIINLNYEKNRYMKPRERRFKEKENSSNQQ